MSIGIYVVECVLNNKKYIGQSINMAGRFNWHECMLTANRHSNQFLQSSWNKYGSNSFIFYPLYECEIDELDAEEIRSIAELKSSNSRFGYNLDGGGCFKSKIISDATRKKLSLANSGEGNPFFGRQHSDSSKAKIGLSSKGRVGYWRGKTIPEVTRKKLRIANKGKTPPNKGVPATEESKRNHSQKMMGNKIWVGKHHTEESKQKMRKPKSEETKAKLKEAWIRRRERMGLASSPNSSSSVP